MVSELAEGFQTRRRDDWDVAALEVEGSRSSIPISKHRNKDRLSWHFSQLRQARNKKDAILDAPQTSNDCTELWKWNWKIKVLPKIQYFINQGFHK